MRTYQSVFVETLSNVVDASKSVLKVGHDAVLAMGDFCVKFWTMWVSGDDDNTGIPLLIDIVNLGLKLAFSVFAYIVFPLLVYPVSCVMALLTLVVGVIFAPPIQSVLMRKEIQNAAVNELYQEIAQLDDDSFGDFCNKLNQLHEPVSEASLVLRKHLLIHSSVNEKKVVIADYLDGTVPPEQPHVNATKGYAVAMFRALKEVKSDQEEEKKAREMAEERVARMAAEMARLSRRA